MRTIRSSLSVWLSLIILIVGLSAGFFYYNRAISHARNEFDKYISNEMESLTNDLSYLLWNRDDTTINYLSEQRLRDDGIGAIIVLDGQGRVVFSNEDQVEQKSIQVNRDIFYNENPVGKLEVIFDQSKIERIQREIWGATGFVLLIIIIAAILAIQVLLSRFLSAQLIKLRDAILRLSQGNYKQSLNPEGKGEIKSIIDGVNLLSEKLVQRDLEITEYTAALKSKNEELSSEISERMNTETALRQSEEKYKTLFENANDAIYLIDHKTGQIHDCNNKAFDMLGYSREDILKMKILDLHPEEEAHRLIELFRSQYKNGLGEGITGIHHKTKDGKLIPIEVNFSIVEIGDKKLNLSVIRDISDRLEKGKKIRESEERLRMILDATSDGVWGINSGEDQTYMSPNLCKTLGYEPEEMQITMEQWRDLIHPEDRTRVLATIKGHMKNKKDEVRLEYRVQSKTKGWLWIINRAKIFDWDEDGNPVDLIGTIENVTEYKNSEEEKKRLEMQLQHSQKMEAIGTLAGGIAHDFNNILASIIGFTELALDEVEEDTELEDDLQEVYTAGKRAKDLVKQILTFARQADEDVKPIQVSTIAKEALKLLRATIPSEIEIRQKIESDSMIMGDPAQVQQILLNLCTNAAQAMEEDMGILYVNLSDVNYYDDPNLKRAGLKPGEYIKLTVSDSGPGISPDIIGFVFEPYFTTKNPGQGTGLGLSIVHGIVKSYNGEILVDSEEGKGATFTIYLPLIMKHSKSQVYIKEDLGSGSGNILIVDDEPQITKMGSQTMERLGYNVTSCNSSPEALELFKAQPDMYDLVITDMSMPHMTGDRLAKELIEIRPDIPIILTTGYSRKINNMQAAEIGIKAFMMKPLTKKNIAQTIREVLRTAKHTV